MNNKIAIISLRFAPAFASHIIAYGKACESLGLEVQYILNPQYAMFSELAAHAPTTYMSGSRPVDTRSLTHALFCNISISNRRFALQLKASGVMVAYLYHEPWIRLADYLVNENMWRCVKATAAHWHSISMLKLADRVIVPSKYALDMYRRSDIRYNSNVHCVPLLFDDEAPVPAMRERRYFSFIGSIEKSHGFDQYVGFMRYAFRNGLDIRFMIASKCALLDRTFKEKLFQDNMDRIAVLTGRPLLNQEINECYAESICVWNLYRRSTQSGVLPNAFMCGAPVIASRTGAFPEFVEDGMTGKFTEGWNHEGIAAAFNEIHRRNSHYSANCRERFRRVFYFAAHMEKLRSILR